ncbi:zinc ribbon domain-containing protein [Desulfovibrio sp.]|uniref:FmdB family zinc ribbon protein n=1 Tax=Desulfovibrio sp. TaxID=885 RepID=UPI0025BA8AF0|nr:zinc ribbon domain-containing protein [Desulfovibrio sp.]MCI7567900.1 zinc ribbon domain-containing protein [Desulfovibrio sp.]
MPMYDYICASCGAKFEELRRSDDETAPVCPACGGTDTQRQLSVPSPLKTGAFPFKVGPVHPLASKMGKGLAGCGGSCGTCASASPTGCGGPTTE